MGEAEIFLKHPNKDLSFSKETLIDAVNYKNDSNEKKLRLSQFDYNCFNIYFFYDSTFCNRFYKRFIAGSGGFIGRSLLK